MKAPIFVIGTGRSGTTIFFKILKDHPNVSWLSQYALRYPNKIYIHRLALQLLRYPIIGKALQKHLFTGEFYPFWDEVFPGFKLPCRDLLAEDVTSKVKNDFKKTIARLIVQNRDQFIAKITGWPRIGFIQEIFPNARFIHVIRDGRAVAYSLFNYKLWWGWQGPQNWRWGTLPPELSDLWDNSNRSFLALAAIQWIILEDAFSKAIEKSRKGSVLDVRYERLCANPIEVFEQVSDFCQLEKSKEFFNCIKRYKIKNENDKWQKELSLDQKNTLDSVLLGYLDKFGY